MKYLLNVTFLLFASGLSAQSLLFEKRFDTEVKDSSGNSLKHAWVGGFNACIMGEIDLNFDGKNDLLVYDKHAQKIFTFVNFGENGHLDFRYAPQYETCFPKFTTWFRLLDFNGDGLSDLFVFDGLSGISVYKNISQNPIIKFELYIPKLQAKIFNDYMDLYCASVDFPSFVDVDGDGDLDLLNFWIPSAENTLYYYKNHSQEKYGHADSLDFILADRQWGCFKEHSESNQILLNICEEVERGTWKMENAEEKMPNGAVSHCYGQSHNCQLSIINYQLSKHTGSTIFATDLNNDALQDLLLADIGYPNMVALYNDGTRENAKITHLDTAFPRQSTPVQLLNCPAISAIDVDLDGVKELIFSPFDDINFSTDGYASNWVYKNMSNSENADYQLISKRFLQDEMLDFGMGAYPTVVDIDGDGLLDIVVGNYGVIDSAWEELGAWKSRFVSDLTLLKNTGTPNEPIFQVFPLTITPKLDCSAAVPTFGDLNNDGHLDLLVGTETGEILWYKATPRISHLVPDFVLESENILDENIGNFLAPQLFDLNNDGLLDLIVGDQRTIWRDAQNRPYFKGNIFYLQNIGTRETPEFTMITDSLGRVDVCNREHSNYGYSKPCFFKDNDGNTRLFCGNEDGKILHYTDIDDNLSGEFRRLNDLSYSSQNPQTSVKSTITEISEGAHAAVAVADFNHDGYMDLVVGNHRGGLTLFYGVSTSSVKDFNIDNNFKIKIFPNPTQHQLYIQTEKNATMPYEILDVQGRVMRSGQSVKNAESIDVTTLSSGIYLLKITLKNHKITKKFIKN